MTKKGGSTMPAAKPRDKKERSMLNKRSNK